MAANAEEKGICSMNLSLGDSKRHAEPCGDGAYEAAFQRARAAGVVAAVAAGNEYFADALSSPAWCAIFGGEGCGWALRRQGARLHAGPGPRRRRRGRPAPAGWMGPRRRLVAQLAPGSLAAVPLL